MRSVRSRAAIAASIFSFLPLVGGCNLVGGDDSPSADPTAVAEADLDVAEGVSGTSVELLGGMIGAASGLEAPQPAPFRSESVSWNGQTGFWTVTGDEAYDDPEATGTVTYTFTVQILEDGTPVQYVSDLTDEIHISATVANTGNFHPADRDFDVDYDFDVVGSLIATNDAGVVSASGSGSLDGSTQAHIGDATVARQQDAAWTYAFTVDTNVQDACAAGTFNGTTNAFTFDGSFAGGVASWNVRRDGAVVRTVTEDLPCDGGGQ
jgi:hypothetical protein